MTTSAHKANHIMQTPDKIPDIKPIRIFLGTYIRVCRATNN